MGARGRSLDRQIYCEAVGDDGANKGTGSPVIRMRLVPREGVKVVHVHDQSHVPVLVTGDVGADGQRADLGNHSHECLEAARDAGGINGLLAGVTALSFQKTM